ncbi:hypothetical protein IGI47_002710 [Enterococcus sp. AZ191]|nr:Uncharacterised protein [Enterococcus faecium]
MEEFLSQLAKDIISYFHHEKDLEKRAIED